MRGSGGGWPRQGGLRRRLARREEDGGNQDSVGYAVGCELAQEKRKVWAMLWRRWRGLRWRDDGEFRRWGEAW
jgi:hypothetical protein